MNLKTITKKISWRVSSNLYVSLYYYYKIRQGYRIYKNIFDTMDDESILYLCPYKGTGDVYIAAMLLSQYNKAIAMSQIQLVVIGNGNKKVAQLFNVENIVSISQEDMDLLIRFILFVGEKLAHVVILHPDAPNVHTGICDRLRNYNGLNFMDMYTKVLYRFNDFKIVKPSFEDAADTILSIFQDNSLIPGKTVLIAPYTYTLMEIPDWVWIKLTKNLMANGYCVCTNCGNKNEKEIAGTIRIELPYKQMDSFLRYAGYFVGIRSGLCEIISSIDCKKIIIYQPYLFWGAGTNYDYFNMYDMGLCKDAIEIEYQGIEFYELIDKIEKAIYES